MIEDKVLQVNLSKIFENFKFICIEAFKSKFLWAIFIFMFILSLAIDLQNKNLGLIQALLFAGIMNIFVKDSKKVVIFMVAGLVTLIILMLITFVLIVILNEFNLHSIAYIISLMVVGLYTILFLYFMPFLIFKLKKMQDANFVFKDFLRILVFSLKIKIKNYFKAFLFMILVYIISIGIGIFLVVILKGNMGVVISTLITNILPTIFIASIASSIEEEN